MFGLFTHFYPPKPVVFRLLWLYSDFRLLVPSLKNENQTDQSNTSYSILKRHWVRRSWFVTLRFSTTGQATWYQLYALSVSKTPHNTLNNNPTHETKHNTHVRLHQRPLHYRNRMSYLRNEVILCNLYTRSSCSCLYGYCMASLIFVSEWCNFKCTCVRV